MVLVDLNYYSRRIDELEERKTEISSKIYMDKLTLKSINEEIKKCDEAIQRLGEPTQKEFMVLTKQIKDLKQDLSEKENEIETLENTIDKKDLKIQQLSNTLGRVRTRRKNLSEENSKLKYELEHAKKTIHNLEQKLLFGDSNDDEDIILSENFGKENIFETLRESENNQ